MTGFLNPKKVDDLFAGQPVGRLLAAAADVVVAVDKAGVVLDASSNIPGLPADSLRGRKFIETLALDSRPKAVDMLAETSSDRRFEINHRLAPMQDVSVTYTVLRNAAGDAAVFCGRDLSSIAALQQRLVEAQRLADEQFLKVRGADARYRILFHISSEAIVIVDAGSHRVVDLNPAAADLFQATPGRLVGKRFVEVVGGDRQYEIEQHLQTVRFAGRLESARAHLSDGQACWLAAALFRDGDASQILLRIAPGDAPDETAAPAKARALRLIEDMPDAFAALDADRRVIDANAAFLRLVDVASLAQARGQVVDRWLGRSNVEGEVLFSNLREHGAVRAYAAGLRNEHGRAEDVVVSGVCTQDSDATFYGLLIRPEAGRGRAPLLPAETSRSADELAELVGRVPLKELVRETTEITERLCIEASLRLTGDNRAAAAQMLGLSRQGLYDKLRRYDMIEAVPDL